jgi:outer membrane protein OmpA-like peptidoglycan-associated protein
MKKSWIAFCVAIMFFLGGCAQWAQMTRTEKVVTAVAGCGLVGAGIGAGADSSRRGRGAVIGSLSSALICGALAYFLTEEPRAVAAPAPPPPSRPAAPPPAPRAERTIILDNVLFDFDKTAIKPDGAKVLDRLIAFLKENPDRKVELEGHTDSVGSDQYNQGLSERRAASVRDYVVKGGVNKGRISTRGFGESKPIADNKTADGRAKNRRVEIKVR